jgi:hypothetical protein
MAAAGWGVMNRRVNVDSVATLVGRTAAGALTANTLNLNNGIVSQLVPVLRGEVSYELSNHLGNVLSTISVVIKRWVWLLWGIVL